MVIDIYCHQLPFYLICGGAPHQIQPHFTSFQQKCLEKFFRRPAGALAPSGYTYASLLYTISDSDDDDDDDDDDDSLLSLCYSLYVDIVSVSNDF